MKIQNSWETKKVLWEIFWRGKLFERYSKNFIVENSKESADFQRTFFLFSWKIWDLSAKIYQFDWQKMRIIGFVLLQTIFTADEVYVAGKIRSKMYSKVL